MGPGRLVAHVRSPRDNWVLLDATIHPDMAPFSPLNHHNPFFGLLSTLQTILISLLLFAVGGGVILVLSYRRHAR